MNIIQILVMACLMLIALGILLSAALLGHYAYVEQLEQRSQKRLRARLESPAHRPTYSQQRSVSRGPY